MHAEKRDIQDPLVQHDLVEAALGPGVVLGLARFSDFRHRSFRDRGLIGEHISEGDHDISHRHPAH